MLLNDFVSNGYGIIDLKPEEVLQIYEPDTEAGWFDDNVKLVLGIGTGLGAC
jgi:glucokinase